MKKFNDLNTIIVYCLLFCDQILVKFYGRYGFKQITEKPFAWKIKRFLNKLGIVSFKPRNIICINEDGCEEKVSLVTMLRTIKKKRLPNGDFYLQGDYW